MSLRLQQLRKGLRRQTLTRDDDKLGWLNHASFTLYESNGYDEWEEMMNMLARRMARARGVDIVEAWFSVARVLAASVPDPEDMLIGIILASIAWNSGLRYEEPSTYAKLFGLLTAVCPKSEPDVFYFILCRMEDVEAALAQPLEDDSIIPPEMLADPFVVVDASNLLWGVVVDLENSAKSAQIEFDDEQIDRCIEYGGHYLWAAYHARRAGVDREELTDFVTAFIEDWFGLMSDLVRRDALASGVLDALILCDATPKQLTEESPDLVATWRRHHAGDLPLKQYLNQIFSAVEQNA
ncbi:MAG: hypothetical protein WC654_02430 [Patescibacteria group bacterium]